jgi:6-phosphogluconolactonase (cycloisomerase 2 family)
VGSLAPSADGNDVYVGGHDSVTHLKRNRGGRLAFGSCVADNGAYGCKAGEQASLGDVLGLAISADGRSVYAGSNARKNAITEFKRRPNGTLKYSGCIADSNAKPGTSGCSITPHRSLNDNEDLAVAPDGRNVYVASDGSSSLTAFARADDGALAYEECFSQSGRMGCKTTKNNALSGAIAVAVSADSRTVYLASDRSDSVSWFHRNSDGTLVFRGCVASAARHGCDRAPGLALDGPSDIATGPDAKFVYISASDGGAIGTFRRADSGALRFRRCMSVYSSQACDTVPGRVLNFPEGLEVSANGRWLYAASVFPGILSVYRVNARGTPVYKTCFRDGGRRGCQAPGKPSIGQPFGLAVDTNPASVYAAGRGVSAFAER